MMKIQETVDFQIRGTLFAMRRMYNLLAAEIGTTQGVAYVLINVPKGGVAATRIAPMMGMGVTSLSRLLKTMEDDGLIYRIKDKEDRRVVFIHLTEKGTMLRKKVRQVIIDFNNRVMPQLSQEEINAFVKVCSLIRTEVCHEISRFGNHDCNEENNLI
jgi:MarR family transcriptional regulator, organic hydroperoxide resistance regulator